MPCNGGAVFHVFACTSYILRARKPFVAPIIQELILKQQPEKTRAYVDSRPDLENRFSRLNTVPFMMLYDPVTVPRTLSLHGALSGLCQPTSAARYRSLPSSFATSSPSRGRRPKGQTSGRPAARSRSPHKPSMSVGTGVIDGYQPSQQDLGS